MDEERKRLRREWARFLSSWRPPELDLSAAGFITGVLGYELTDFQRRWWEFAAERKAALVLAPRGHGKSTVLTVAFTLHRALSDPETRALICSNTAAQAEALLREVRRHLESNERITSVRGRLAGRPWTESELTLFGRERGSKEATVTALGVLGPIISRHYDVIVLDDVVDEDAARSKAMREKLATWYYKELLPTLEPEGELRILGTRYHPDDLYGRLLGAGVPALVERAISGEGDGERALWEAKFPLALLRQKRAEAGAAIFNAQYQNDVAAMTGRVFRPEWMEIKAPAAARRKWQGVDLAIGTGDQHDYFAHVTVAEPGDGSFQVAGAYQARLSFEEQCRAVRNLFRLHDRPDCPVARIGVEANAYQEALAQRLRGEGLPVSSITQTRDKVTRAYRMQGLFETGRVSFVPAAAAPGVPDLIEQLLCFPDGDHDDLVDALEMALRTAQSSNQYLDLPFSNREISVAGDDS